MDPKQSFLQKLLKGERTTYNRGGFMDKLQKQYGLPDAIPQDARYTFIKEAQKAGVTPQELSQIVNREQGPGTQAEDVALVGGADPTDRGIMQVNKVNEPLIQEKFQAEFGRPYNPNNAVDSIIGSRMVLQENRRIFEQKKKNKTLPGGYTSEDLINSYNLGPNGIVQARQGVPEKVFKLNRYEQAGVIN